MLESKVDSKSEYTCTRGKKENLLKVESSYCSRAWKIERKPRGARVRLLCIYATGVRGPSFRSKAVHHPVQAVMHVMNDKVIKRGTSEACTQISEEIITPHKAGS